MSSENEKVEKVYYFMYEVREFLFKKFEYVDKNVEYMVSEAHELKSTYDHLNEKCKLETLSIIKRFLSEIFTIYISMVNGDIQDYSEDNLDVLYLNNKFSETFELIDSMHINKVSILTQRRTISEDEKLLLDDIIVATKMFYGEIYRLHLGGCQTQIAHNVYEEVETIVNEYHSYDDDERLNSSTELLVNVIYMCERYVYDIKNYNEDDKLKEVLIRAYFRALSLKETLMFKHLGR